MTPAYFQSLSGSRKSFQLTDDQLIYLAGENKISKQQILSIHNKQTTKILLDPQQFCSLIYQHNQLNSSTEHFHDIQKRLCLNVEQVFILANHSNIELHQLATCKEQTTNVSINKTHETFVEIQSGF